MQVAAPPSALLLPAHDQAFTGPPEGAVQQDGVGGDGDVLREVVKQGEVALAVVLVRGPLRDDEGPGLPAAQRQGHHDLGASSMASGGCRRLLAGQDDGGVRCA